MAYIRVSDGSYPYSERNIKNLFPNVSFPTPFRSPDFEWVFPSPKPTITILQKVIEGSPVFTDKNTWEQTWEIADRFETYTDDEGVVHTKEEQEQQVITQETEKQNQAMKAACEKLIAEKIQSEIDKYNDENNLVLENIRSCALYAQVDGYTHQAFCQAVWEWNVQVWETARTLLYQELAGEITISEPEEVMMMLPVFTFNG